ncbi:protein kinase [Phototrophicus methaneseepsis]|uniref:non-specific serine/threonine protein kinase n=1 Tax=Phototrophicus methaneseepsis TaxID=2710758 RepID=A0A7S8E9K9_9CHLR|nr:serine/threonine-protein kinase [Phototrophicus methaneseepsis]QPC82901.1 protein kinase [Phototrophicus methaneseepsis]
MTIRIGDRFELNTEPAYILGEGGMGTVYEGVDSLTGQKVAIKRLSTEVVRDRPETLERFAREAEALRRLNHPNIVDVIATINEDNEHYIVMEYVPGGSLRDILDEHGPLPLRRVLEIALDLADALTRAHRLKIIHRDLKPGNILLAQDGTPRLTDFGVAHLDDKPDVTRTGAVVGTVSYLPPEALNGHPLDERADIWGFGVVLYEMLIGQRPFEGETVTARVTAILTHPMPDMSRLRYDVPVSVQSLIGRMLAKEPTMRISSVRQIGTELESMLHQMDRSTQVIPQMGGPTASSGRFETTPGHPYQPNPEETEYDFTQGDEAVTRDIRYGAPNPRLQVSNPPTAETSSTETYTIPQPQTQQSETARPAKRPLNLWLMGAAVLVIAVVGIALFVSNLSSEGETDESAVPIAATGHYRVLFAELEPLSGATERDVTRILVDSLEQRYEVADPGTHLDIVTYPNPIRSANEAITVANQENAAVVIWGTYDDVVIRLDVQVGDVSLFPTMHFPRSLVERIANVRIELTDPQNEKIAPYVAGVMAVLHAADGNLVEWTRMVAAMPTETTLAQAVSSVATSTHCFLQQYLAAPDDALTCINAAISTESGNAILYWMRGMALNRRFLIEFVDERLLPSHLNLMRDRLEGDFSTAKRLGPDNWAMPLYTQLDGTSVGNRKNNLTIANSLNEIEAAIRLRPNDWAPLYIRAELAFKSGDVAGARMYISRALASNPDVTLPYTSALLLALRTGDLPAAKDYIETILAEFPDTTVSRRLFDVLVGVTMPESLVPGVVSNLVIGQYEAASSLLQAFNAEGNSSPGLFDGDFTLILLSGVAQCGQGHYEQAQLAFNNVINFDRDFMVARLLRASAYRRLGDTARAENDLNAVRQSDQAELLLPYADAVEAGTLTCANIFEIDELQD